MQVRSLVTDEEEEGFEEQKEAMVIINIWARAYSI